MGAPMRRRWLDGAERHPTKSMVRRSRDHDSFMREIAFAWSESSHVSQRTALHRGSPRTRQCEGEIKFPRSLENRQFGCGWEIHVRCRSGLSFPTARYSKHAWHLQAGIFPMMRSHRAVHRALWPILALAVGFGLAMALVRRPPSPATPQTTVEPK